MKNNKYPGVYPAKDINGNIVENKYVLRIVQTINGEVHRDTRTVEAGTIKKAYDIKIKLMNELKMQYETGVTVKPNNLTFGALVENWITVNKSKNNKEYSPTSLEGYRKLLDRHILPYFSQMFISKISRATIVLYMDDLKLKNPHLSERSIRNIIMLIRSIFRFAEDRDYISANPCSKIVFSDTDSDDPVFFDDQQLSKIINLLDVMVDEKINSFNSSIKYNKLDDIQREKVENLRLIEVLAKRLFVNLAIVTGARRGEIIGLKWSDINYGEYTKVVFKGSAFTVIGATPEFYNKLKNKNKSKLVYINSNIVPMLKEYKSLQDKVIKQQGWKHQGYIFLTYRDGRTQASGTLARPDSYSRWFSKWCWENREVLGFTEDFAKLCHVHMLRHSFVSYELNSGVNVRVVASLAGHRDVTVTLNKYAHSYNNSMMQAADAFDNLYNK